MFTFSQWVELLVKARGHKYIKRIPYNTPKGRRYRYIYNVTHSHRGKHAMDESHLQVGTAFMVHTESGSEVHGHIKSISGESVTYVLDDGPNKGQQVTKTKSEIVSMLNEKHNVNEQVQSKRDTLKQQLQTARDNKASEKQIARIQERLDRLGGSPAEEKTEGLNPQFASILEKHRVSPDLLNIKKLYGSVHPTSVKRGTDGRWTLNPSREDNVYDPNGSMFRRLVDLEGREKQACDTYNAGLETSLREIQDRIGPLIDEYTKLGEDVSQLKSASADLNAQEEVFNKFLQAKSKLGFNMQSFGPSFITMSFRALQKKDPYMLGDMLDLLQEYGMPLPQSKEEMGTGVMKYIMQHRESLFRGKKFRELAGVRDVQDELKQRHKKLESQIEEAFDDIILKEMPKSYKSTRTPLMGSTRKNMIRRHSHILDHVQKMTRAVYPEFERKKTTVSYWRKPRAGSSYFPDGSLIKIKSSEGDKTVLHEAVHALEYHIPSIVDAVTLSYRTRTRPHKVQRYGINEQAYSDEFQNNYTGKLYNRPEEKGGYRASEFVTMGYQEMRTGSLARFLSTDLHHFAVVYGVMKGHFK